jgi:hypothetical protein
MPLGKPKGGNPAGRPPGIPNLEARVRALLDGDTLLPEPIAVTSVEYYGDSALNDGRG